MKTRKRMQQFDVAVYLKVKGESAEEVDHTVYRFCAALKKLLGKKLIVKSVEVDK
jgi:hypothetical protein